MAGMRVIFGIVAFKAPRGVYNIAHVVAAIVGAKLLGSDFLARIRMPHRSGVIIGHPRAHLGKLLGDNRIVTVEAILTRLGMLRHKHARVARRIALDVVVHRTVANGVAEARLLMPHPKTSTRRAPAQRQRCQPRWPASSCSSFWTHDPRRPGAAVRWPSFSSVIGPPSSFSALPRFAASTLPTMAEISTRAYYPRRVIFAFCLINAEIPASHAMLAGFLEFKWFEREICLRK